MPYELINRSGKKYTKGFTLETALQRQRQMEREMRTTRELAVGYREGGNDEAYRTAKAKYTAQRAEYSRFSSAMNIKEQWNRITVDGLGRI